jgi:hypothetical protein
LQVAAACQSHNGSIACWLLQSGPVISGTTTTIATSACGKLLLPIDNRNLKQFQSCCSKSIQTTGHNTYTLVTGKTRVVRHIDDRYKLQTTASGSNHFRKASLALRAFAWYRSHWQQQASQDQLTCSITARLAQHQPTNRLLCWFHTCRKANLKVMCGTLECSIPRDDKLSLPTERLPYRESPGCEHPLFNLWSSDLWSWE